MTADSEPGEEALAGDFIQLLIREGLVKPEGLAAADWETWNAGYNVGLRVEVLLNELDPHVARMLLGAKGRSNSTKFWTWRVWSSGDVDVGLAFLAAEWTDRPRTSPGVHCWVLNRKADDAAAMAAVGVTAANRSHWTESPQVRGAYGLNPYGPATRLSARSCQRVGISATPAPPAASSKSGGTTSGRCVSRTRARLPSCPARKSR